MSSSFIYSSVLHVCRRMSVYKQRQYKTVHFGVSYIKTDMILMVLVQYVRNFNPYATWTFLFLKQNCLRNCSKITSNRKLFNIHTAVKYQNRASRQAAGNTSIFATAVRGSGISLNKKIKLFVMTQQSHGSKEVEVRMTRGFFSKDTAPWGRALLTR